MAVKKKKNFNFDEEVSLYSNFQENYEEELAEFKRKLDERKKAHAEKFKTYEDSYNLDCNENRILIAKEIFSIFGISDYPELKEALSNGDYDKASFNKTKDFNIICKNHTDFIFSVLNFIRTDDVIVKRVKEYCQLLKEENADNDTKSVEDSVLIEGNE